MSLSQCPVLSDHVSVDQNIELSTIKFVDSPSVDDTLCEWYLPPPPSVSATRPSTISGINNVGEILADTHLHSHNLGPLREDLVNGRIIQRSSKESMNMNPKIITEETGKAELSSFSGFQPLRSVGCCSSCLEMNTVGSGSDIEGVDSGHFHNGHDHNYHEPERDNYEQQQQPYKRQQHVHHQQHDYQHHEPSYCHSECTGHITDIHGSVHQHGSSQHYQPSCCTAGLHANFNSDRRLPDYVTIDQCYTGMDDPECRTICLIANFDAGSGKTEPDQRQGQVPRPGVPGEVSSKKDKTSLRRGVKIRHLSVNPTREQPMHLLSEMRFDDSTDHHTEQGLNVKDSDLLEASADNRRLSNCSFSRVPFNHYQPQGTQVPLLSLSAAKETVEMEAVGGDSASLNKDGDAESSTWESQTQASPSVRMKMKNLGLSNVAVNRFRLTFDETADAADNRNIELPIEVTPHSLGTKRPSCICGEPELPPAQYFSLPQENSDLSQSVDTGNFEVNNYQSGMYPYSPHDTLENTLTGQPVTAVSNTYAYSSASAFHSPIPKQVPTYHSELDQESTFLNIPNLMDSNQKTTKDDNSTKVQTQTEVGHQRVTICISNSQQSLIPYSSDSPTFDPVTDDQFQMNDFLNYHQNNNHYTKDSCGYPENISSTDYTNFLQQQHFHHSNYTDDLAHDISGHAEDIKLMSMHDTTRPLLQHQDTVSAPPIQDLYRYHVFFSHCPEDREWVEHIVAHLEAHPFNYTCAYASLQDEADPGTLQQRILCAAMLSERVVLVLSKQYVEDVWFSFEKTLKQLTKMSLHNQRIMGVLLEDCQIPETLGELYFLDSSDPDFFQVFAKRLKTSRIPRSSASVSSDLGQNAINPSNVTNGKILTFCRLQVKVGWDSFLIPADGPDLDIPPSLSAHGIGMEKTEFEEIVTKVSGIVSGSNKLPWLLSAQPMLVLLLAGGLWLPAFIAVLVIHVDDDSGIALPVRLVIFLFPLGMVAGGYLIKWRRAYWLTKTVRLLVQNCVDVNQALYFQGRPLFVTAAHVRANIFARSVDLLLFTCMEEDWEKLIKLITFYTRDENYLSRMSISERLTVMMSAPYLVKLVKQVLPHPPQQRHVTRLLCLCQFTEECISRFAHGLDREDVPGLAELFTRHMPGKVSGSAARRVQEELFHANHGLVP